MLLVLHFSLVIRAPELDFGQLCVVLAWAQTHPCRVLAIVTSSVNLRNTTHRAHFSLYQVCGDWNCGVTLNQHGLLGFRNN